jgi:uncharacterized protein YecE (DUF72 family)
MKKLKHPEEPLERLMTAAQSLQEKLGPVLFQFLRQWRVNLERLDGLLPLLEQYRPARFTFEFRHESWLTPAVYERLERAGCALCLPVGWSIPLDARLTAPWTYIRMHGGESSNAFSDSELQVWADRIARLPRTRDRHLHLLQQVIMKPGGVKAQAIGLQSGRIRVVVEPGHLRDLDPDRNLLLCHVHSPR